MQHPCVVVIPGEALEHAFAAAPAHGGEVVAAGVEVLDGGGEGIDVVGRDEQAVVAIDNGVAGLGGGDEGQGAGGGFEGDLGEAFAFGGEDEGGAAADPEPGEREAA